MATTQAQRKKTITLNSKDIETLEELTQLLQSSEAEVIRRSIRLLALLRRWEDQEGEILLRAKNGESRLVTIL